MLGYPVIHPLHMRDDPDVLDVIIGPCAFDTAVLRIAWVWRLE